MSDHVYKHVELTGSSTISSDHAISVAIAKAGQTLRNMHWFRVSETRGLINKDKIAHWQVTITVGFTLED
jgi:flavin-binding protein dodecin